MAVIIKEQCKKEYRKYTKGQYPKMKTEKILQLTY